MSKTALELTAEERRAYRILLLPSRIRQSELAERWQRAWQLTQEAAHLLRSRFGAKRVVLFGSLSDQALFTPWSDIDLAAEGISASEFYRAVGVVSALSAEFEIDLIDIDNCKPTMRQVIKREGVAL
ncbi:MAG: nucleotidyltransferase domain-containing protein [bacterium]|nr:nucleotidyltransferase domain-containing protein [bacterium]